MPTDKAGINPLIYKKLLFSTKKKESDDKRQAAKLFRYCLWRQKGD